MKRMIFFIILVTSKNIRRDRLASFGHAFLVVSLTAIEIPASIELIEDGAFADCHSLTVITFEKNSNLKAIGNSAFDSD